MMTTDLAGALTLVEDAAQSAGLDPAQARLEAMALSATVAESAPGAFPDWCAQVGVPESAQSFTEAASRGRRFRATPTPLLGQLLASGHPRAAAYSDALQQVCSTACLLGRATPESAGAASMAAAAQSAVPRHHQVPPSPPGVEASTGPVAEQLDEFTRRAPTILNSVLDQLRRGQERLRASGITPAPIPEGLNTNPFDLGPQDASHVPGAFNLTGTPSPVAPVGSPQPGAAEAATTEPTGQTADEEPEEEPRTVEELLAELDELIGLGTVKTEIKRQAAILRVEGLRRDQGLRSTTITRHLVFVGNPGTGKTTVARLVAGIYRALGLLSKGQLVEVDRSELVAGYLGQTALKTSEVVARAEGGVLFIDEAYSLNGDQYGEEAINTLVKEMEDKRDNLVVIVAGYPLPMAEFISHNPGLSSRFNTTIEFDNYSDDEIVAILELMADKADYDLSPDTVERFRSLLARQVRDFTFGNGRFARNMLEGAIGRHAWRLREIEEPTLEDLRTLRPEDFAEAGAADVVEWEPRGSAGSRATTQVDETGRETSDAVEASDATVPETNVTGRPDSDTAQEADSE